ncbi:MAG: PAS domain S-box protein [Planctomycetes bacterium]|nr:PAS domain S-box protein [Planctomycetota bacterium]
MARPGRKSARSLAHELEVVRAEVERLRAQLVESTPSVPSDDMQRDEQHWRLLVESIDGIVSEYDVDDDRFTFVSARAEFLLGFSVAEWCEPGFWSRQVHPDDLPTVMADCLRAVSERRDHTLEYRMIGRLGQVVWLHDHVTVVDGPDRVRLVGVMLDVTARKRAEALVRQASAHLSALVESLAAGVLVADADGRISMVNAAFGRLFGLAEPIGLIGESSAHVLARIAAGFTERDAFLARVASDVGVSEPSLVREFVTLRGRYLEVSRAPIDVPDNRRGHLWQFADVTSRRRAERALQRIATGTSRALGDEFFRSLVENVARALGVHWVVLFERDESNAALLRTRAVWDGDGLAENFELELPGTPCEVVLRDGVAFYPGTLRENFGSHPYFGRLGAHTYFGTTVRGSSGETLGVLAVFDDGAPTMATEVASILGVFADRAAVEIERLRAESALRQSETRHRALLDALPDMIFLLDAEGRFLDCHAADRTALLLDPGLFLGRRFVEVLPPDVVAVLTPMFERVLETRSMQTGEYTAQLRGAERRFEARMVPCGPDRVLTIARDIGERHRLQTELAHAQKMESVGRLAGGVAHDFNNLLTGILGYAELGQQLLPAATPGANYFARIQSAAERAAELTRQLLAFARKQVIDARVLSPATAISEMLGFVQRVIGEDVELVTAFARDTAHVRIDPTQLHQVILNLLVNARDALPHGGRVVVATQNVSHAPNGAPEREFVRISVIDDGVGMSPEVRAHAFEPFFTTKPEGRGTGMGLATCYGIVSQHGGHIEIASELGVGTRVDVYLPRVERAAVESAHAGADTVPRGTESILLVEDDAVVRELVAGGLETLGYSVRAAADAAEARALWRESAGRFDVLVTDVIMPAESGAALADALRSERADLFVLYMSGYTASSVSVERLERPGVGFLSKPFTTGELARKLRSLLDSAGPDAGGDARPD